MKILLTCHSVTGNTKKIADHIAKMDYDIDYLDMKEVEHFDYDLILVGGWIDKGTFNKEVIEYISKIKNKNIGFFFTLGAYPNQAHAYDCITDIRKIFTDNGNKVLSHVHAQGPIQQIGRAHV